MTKNQKKIFIRLLNELADQQSNAGCNDFEVPNTPDVREMLLSVIEDEDEKGEIRKAKGKKIVTTDFLFTEWCKKFIEQLPETE